MHDPDAMVKFYVGERVSFELPGQGRLAGLLIKYIQKAVNVQTDTDRIWKVSTSLLSKIRTVSGLGDGRIASTATRPKL